MKLLNKHLLDFNSSLEYVKDNLHETNKLCSSLLNLINFKNGYFFTLLPENSYLQSIYEFKTSNIFHQNPLEENYLNGCKSIYSIKNSIINEISELIINEIKHHEYLSCIFDDVNFFSEELNGYFLFDKYGLSYDKEPYYLIQKNEVSNQLIKECLKTSNAIWHSLCLFTAASLNRNVRILSLEKIKEICLTTELIIIGAYDAEGYVFWEKQQSYPNKGFFEKG
jgi:hypothetical protein